MAAAAMAVRRRTAEGQREGLLSSRGRKTSSNTEDDDWAYGAASQNGDAHRPIGTEDVSDLFKSDHVDAMVRRAQSKKALDLARLNYREDFNRPLPQEKHRIKTGVLEKHLSGGGWAFRQATLDKESLFLSRPGQNNILEEVPLWEIVQVVRVKDDVPDSDVRKFSPVPATADSRRSTAPEARRVSKEEEECTVFEVRTEVTGSMDGKRLLFRCDSGADCERWLKLLKGHAKLARQERERQIAGTKLRLWQMRAKKVYDSDLCQAVIAALILVSFVLNIANAEIVPDEGTASYNFFESMDTALTLIFLTELMVNYFANAPWAFWEDGWNIFDFCVVTISLLALIMGGSGGINNLRLLRVFRVVRLFRRLRRLKQIINALISSLAPVASSFMVLALVTSIYAVLAVNILRDKDPYHFGYFSTAFFTMGQMCIGWAEEEVRPSFEPDGGPDAFIGLFFLSYSLFAGVVLINIVVAVLLDEFITSVAAERAEFDKHKKEMAQAENVVRRHGPLDPVLDTIAHYGTAEDLTARIEALFQSLDVDESGKLSFREMWRGLQKLNFRPRIELTRDDYEALTEGGELCNDKGEMGLPQFEEMIRRQLQRYSQRNLAYALEENEESATSMKSVMLVLKQLGNSIEMINQEQQMVRRLLMRQAGFDSIPKANGAFASFGQNGHANGMGNGSFRTSSLTRPPEEAMGTEMRARSGNLKGAEKKGMNGHANGNGVLTPQMFNPVEASPTLPNQPVPATPFQAFKPVRHEPRESTAQPKMNGHAHPPTDSSDEEDAQQDRRISFDVESVSDAGSPPPI